MRITVACPETLISDANHLAQVLAFGPADAMTYRGLSWRDAQGNRYAAASFEARDEWVIGAQSPLQRPVWDADRGISMAAAGRAQVALVFATADGTIPQAMPDKLTALAGPSGPDALMLMGLSPIPEEA